MKTLSTWLRYGSFFIVICSLTLASHFTYLNNLQCSSKQTKRISPSQYKCLNSDEKWVYFTKIEEGLIYNESNRLIAPATKSMELEFAISKLLNNTITKRENEIESEQRDELCSNIYTNIIDVTKNLYPEFSEEFDLIDALADHLYKFKIINAYGDDNLRLGWTIPENGMYYIYIYPQRPDILNFTPFIIPYRENDLSYIFPE